MNSFSNHWNRFDLLPSVFCSGYVSASPYREFPSLTLFSGVPILLYLDDNAPFSSLKFAQLVSFYSDSFDYFTPINLAKDWSMVEPTTVVIITITKVTSTIKFPLFYFGMFKHRANAITPLIIPEYQQIFSYFPVSTNGFLRTK